VKRREFVVSGSMVGAGLWGAVSLAPRRFTSERSRNCRFKFKFGGKPVAFSVPPLPYAFDALEPYIDAKTMEIHHDKHHGAYVTNLNKALEGNAALQAKSIDDLLKGLDSVPENIRNAVRNNGGGHWNHTLFWTLMKKAAGVSRRAISEQRSAQRLVRLACSRKSLRPPASAVWFRLGMADCERRKAGD